MLHRKMCYMREEGMLKEKERKKEKDVDVSRPSISQELPSKGTMKYESHIQDICNSLRIFHMITHGEIISDEQIIQLMNKRINLRNKKHLLTELNKQSRIDIGKIFAHILIAIQDENDVLKEIHELCTDDIVSSLSAECKKLNFKYNITAYSYDFNSITVSFLIHLLCNAPKLWVLLLPYCNIQGVNVKEIADALYEEGVGLELTWLNISENNLNDIKSSSFSTLLAVAPKLIHLIISDCSLSGAIIDDMVKECSSREVVLELTYLNISKNNLSDIKGSSLATLLAVAPKLIHLIISDCSLSGAIIDDMI